MQSVCSRCHIQVRPTDYYCFNCGKNLKPAPPKTDIVSQIFLYLKSFLLPPLGLWWALPYLKQKEFKFKLIGVIAIILTLVSIILAIKLTQDFSNILNEQINQSLKMYM